MKQISIVGFGRFGKTLYRLIKDDFRVVLYSSNGVNTKDTHILPSTVIAKNLKEVYGSDVVFFSVPISAFEQVIKQHKKYFRPDHVLIDVLSVKTYPKKIFSKYLKNCETQALLTHPMFGPDSAKFGYAGLPIILDRFKAKKETYEFWKNYFKKKELSVVEMSAEEHDKLAANSQGLTHFIGRLMEKVHFGPTAIDSLGSKKLQEIVEQTCNDTWQLFNDLQTYNPYTKQMRLRLGKAYQELYNKLLPDRVNPKYVVFGIQGGKGSFNEKALEYYNNVILNDSEESNSKSREQLRSFSRSNRDQDDSKRKYKIKYLYTTEKVLKNLHEGNIDFGLFAISNSSGGLVEESMRAVTKYTCTITADFEFLIKHYLMKRKDIDENRIDTIMAHPQVFAQCINTLRNQFKRYKLTSGEGDLIDTAKAAEYLASGKLPKTTAVLGPIGLAEYFNLDIIAEDLQDKKENLTWFLVVKR